MINKESLQRKNDNKENNHANGHYALDTPIVIGLSSSLLNVSGYSEMLDGSMLRSE